MDTPGSASSVLAGAPAGAPAGAAPGAPAGGSAGVPPAAPASQVQGLEWLPNADDVTRGYVQNKGWTEPAQVLEGYRNLEKLLGADRAGNTVVLPKADATPEELGKFYDRLGRPADPSGYKVEIPKELGGNEDFAKAAAGQFHQLGLTKAQGEGIVAWWNKQVGDQKAAVDSQSQQSLQADDAALHLTWGNAFQQNLAQAQAAVRTLGVDAATIDKLQAAMGYKGTMEFFQKLGAKSGEPGFVPGNGNQGFGEPMLTPGQAQAKIADLMKDKNFVANYLKHGAKEVSEMERLHKMAFPE